MYVVMSLCRYVLLSKATHQVFGLALQVTCIGTSSAQAESAWETYAFNSNVLSDSVFVGLGHVSPVKCHLGGLVDL